MKTLIGCLIGLMLNISLSGQPYGKGLIFDDPAYEDEKLSAPLVKGDYDVPGSFSLLNYCPTPGNQGTTGTCTAWALAYGAMTIIRAKQQGLSGQEIDATAFSPAFVYERIKEPADYQCLEGSKIIDGLNLLKEKGVPKLKDFPFQCNPSIEEKIYKLALQNRIKDFKILFMINSSKEEKISTVKKSISEMKPVVIGLQTPESFSKSKDVWTPSSDEIPSKYKGHAILVLGYDDNKYGGAFLLYNSWGTAWGNKGCTWVKYDDFANYTRYAFELIEMPATYPTPPEPRPLPTPEPRQVAQTQSLKGAMEFRLINGSEISLTKISNLKNQDKLDVYTGESLLSYVMSKAYNSDTRFRFYLSNYGEAYVYAIATDLTGKINRIFPQREDISPYLGYSKNTLAFPSETGYIRLDDTKGVDFLCVFYSKEPLDYSKLISDLEATSGPISQRIQKALSDRLADLQAIKFQNNQVAFDLSVKPDEIRKVVPLIVAINHQ